MELSIGLIMTIAIAMFLAAGGTLPTWFLRLRLLAVPALFSIIAVLYLLGR